VRYPAEPVRRRPPAHPAARAAGFASLRSLRAAAELRRPCVPERI